MLDEIRQCANQAAHTFTLDIAHQDMDSTQWALLHEALTQIILKSQEAFLLTGKLRIDAKK